MFHRICNLEKLPPAHNALVLHLQRSQYKAAVWVRASHAISIFPSPEACGWYADESHILHPTLCTLDAVPAVCEELLTCGCKTFLCMTDRCTCKKYQLPCSSGCLCQQSCANPKNPIVTAVEDEQSDDGSDDDIEI